MRRETIRKACFLLVVVGVFWAALLTPAARAAEPVGAKISAIDAKTGVVSANETATGRAFQFQVKDARLLRSLKVGQAISADLKAMTVTLPAARPGAKAIQLRIMKAEPVGTQASPPTGATASPATSGSASQYVEVVFHCPRVAETVAINWKNELRGTYSETGGGGYIHFKVQSGSERVEVKVHRAYRDGQKIRCDYRLPGIVGGGGAYYAYRVHREIISCVSGDTGVRCKVKP